MSAENSKDLGEMGNCHKKLDEKQRKIFTGRFLIAIISTAFGSAFQHGYNTGVMNAPEVIIKGTIESDHLDLIWALIIAAYPFGGMIGGLMSGVIAEKFGRRMGLIFNNFFAIMGSTSMASANISYGYMLLLFGRFLFGINSGLNAGLAPMYLSEITPKNHRGSVGTLYQLFLTVSILFSQIMGHDKVLGQKDLWILLFIISIIPAIFQGIALYLCPNSPRYLLLDKKKEFEARASLKWFRQTDNIEEEMNEIKNEEVGSSISVQDLWKRKELRKPLKISLFVMVAQQLTGINAIIFFSTKIFESAGLTLIESQYATIGMGVANVLTTILSLVIIEKIGRKKLLLMGAFGMLIGTVGFYICQLLLDGQNNETVIVSIVAILFIISYVMSFAIALGPIPWFIVSELFIQEARPPAISIATATNWFSNFLIAIFFSHLNSFMGSHVFLIFIVNIILTIVVTIIVVPETKGKTIAEISALFVEK